MARATYSATALVGTGKSGYLKAGADGYYDNVPLGALEYRNCDGDIYTLKSAKKLIEKSSEGKLRKMIEMGVLRGEYGHPKMQPGESKSAFLARACTITEKNVSHHFSDVYIDDGNGIKDKNGQSIILILGRLKPNGPYGDTLAAQMENNQENVCFSIRAWTDDFEGPGGIIYKDLRDIITWDYVNRPGLEPAQKYLSPSLESFEKVTFTKEHIQTALSTLKEMGINMESETTTNIRRVLEAYDWQIEENKKKDGILLLPPSSRWV